MRQSKIEFIERCSDIKCHLGLKYYSWHDYEDGCYADFSTTRINDVRTLCLLAGNLEFRLLADNNRIIVRVFEDLENIDYGKGETE